MTYYSLGDCLVPSKTPSAGPTRTPWRTVLVKIPSIEWPKDVIAMAIVALLARGVDSSHELFGRQANRNGYPNFTNVLSRTLQAFGLAPGPGDPSQHRSVTCWGEDSLSFVVLLSWQYIMSQTDPVTLRNRESFPELVALACTSPILCPHLETFIESCHGHQFIRL
jgi:hypothetical protein